MEGLAFKTSRLFDAVSKLDCIKPYILVGGTALSLQINHRESEDLDFMKWRTFKDEKMEVDWPNIEKALASVGTVQKVDILDINHVEYYVSDVKFSFYACDKHSPVRQCINFHNNIKLADMKAIMAMKMEVMLRRTNFRDYYDIYSMLKSGLSIHESVNAATKYSYHKLKTKNILAILSNSDRFIPDANFLNLMPKYKVSAQEIATYIKSELANVRDIRISERNEVFTIKATIDREEQLAVNISKEDYILYRDQKIDAFSLVEKYYAKRLSSSNDRDL